MLICCPTYLCILFLTQTLPLFIYLFIYFNGLVTFVPLFLPLLSNALSPTPTVNPPLRGLCPWVLYSCSLIRPFPFFLSLSPSSQPSGHCQFIFLKILFIYFQRDEKGERKRRKETLMYCCLLCAPYWGPGLQPRHVPWLGIEPVGSQASAQCTEPHQPGPSVWSLFPCLWFCFAHLFVLLIKFHL